MSTLHVPRLAHRREREHPRLPALTRLLWSSVGCLLFGLAFFAAEAV